MASVSSARPPHHFSFAYYLNIYILDKIQENVYV